MVNTIVKRALAGKFVLIAEIGVNYYDIARQRGISPLEAAKLMIREARDAGIHAVKFQTYKANTLAAKDSPSYWDTTEETTTSQFELFKKFDLFSYQEYKELAEYCELLDIEFFSTPFDVESADYLSEMMNVYKISSSDLTNLPFIRHQAKKGKPILLSIGASYEDEIARAIGTIREFNNETIILMHCILEYPTPPLHANLNRISTIKQRFPNMIIGYSDHTKPIKSADIIKTAYNLGALVVEKHFTLDKTLPGNDHYHAMDPSDARKILDGIEFIDLIRGNYDIKCLESEMTSRRNARRSLVSTCQIKSGDTVTKDMLTFKRPGTGITPADIEKVVGATAAVDIEEDTILQYSMFNVRLEDVLKR